MKRLIVILLLLIFPLIVLADQAAYITQAQAEKAVTLLKKQKQIKHHCAPCDDQSITTENINTIEASPTGYQDTWEVKVNGEGIDLAYVYFQEKPGKWKNVAKELAIKVEGVPKYLPDEKQ